MKWFKVNGVEYDVRVFEPEETFTVLYSENTGRTLSNGAPMILDPIGTFFNYTMTIGAIKGKEASYEALWRLLSTPSTEPLLFVFPRSRNTLWSTTNDDGEDIEGFYAYVSSGKRGIKRIKEEVNGDLKEVIYDAFSVSFIASKAQVVPE